MADTGMPHVAGGAGMPDELESLLSLYAARRLTPRYGAMARIRAGVFSRIEVRDPSLIDLAAARRARVGRRLVAAGLAAALTIGGAASVLAAGPSSPLYGARLWLESVTLPVAGIDRSEAHRKRLEARILEAQAAARAGDPSAVAQALAAYRAEVDAALADVGDDAEQLTRLEAALATHLVVLEALEGQVPSQAADAIAAAKSASDKAVLKIKEKKAKPPRPNGSGHPNRP